MKDLKNIIIDLWELFFPLLIRIFLTTVILSLILDDLTKTKILSGILKAMDEFMKFSRSFLTVLELQKYLGLYLLIIFILFCYTFNRILFVVNSIIKIKIEYSSYFKVVPEYLDTFLKYFPQITNLYQLDKELRKVIYDSLAENKYKISDDEIDFDNKTKKFRGYTDVFLFGFFTTIILTIIYFHGVIILNSIILILFMIVGIFFNLSRTANEVKKYSNTLLFKIELILDKPKASDVAIKDLKEKLLKEISKKWWTIKPKLVIDVNETIRNLGSLRVKNDD